MKDPFRPYCVGLCAEFAVALHRLYGYPLGIVWDETWDEDYEEWGGVLGHAFVFHPTEKDWIIDAKGSRPLKKMVSELRLTGHRARVEPTTEHGLEWSGSAEGLDEDAITAATKLIRGNQP